MQEHIIRAENGIRDSKLSLQNYVVTTIDRGCGGQNANPVPRDRPGDADKSCNALYAEMSQIDQEIVRKNKGKTDRDIWNIIFFAGGWFVIVPWFFIDAKGSYEIEIDALKARKEHLKILYEDKNCTPPEIKAAPTTK